MEADEYRTLAAPAEAIYTEKRSKFIAIALPVHTLEEVKAHLEELQKKYYDARHVCYAYMLGHERTNFRANDNGEPSGTAGKPILGQINSNVAYRTAAAEALAAATFVERTVDDEVEVTFEYPFLNDVMRVVKEEGPSIVSQAYDMDCVMKLRIRRLSMPRLRERLSKVETLRFAAD